MANGKKRNKKAPAHGSGAQQCQYVASGTHTHCPNTAHDGFQYCDVHLRVFGEDKLNELSLSGRDLYLLARAIEHVAMEVRAKAVSAVKRHYWLVPSITITLLGVAGTAITWGMTDRVIDSAAAKIAQDQELREQVVASAMVRVQASLDALGAAKEDVALEKAKALASLRVSLDRIDEMVRQLEQDVKALQSGLPR